MNIEEYAKQYAFETTLVPPNYYKTGVGTCYRCVAVNIGSPTLEMFDSVWRRPCPSFLHVKLESLYGTPDYTICFQCNGTGYIEPYDLVITFVRRKDRMWNVSLYSTKLDIDCGAIGKGFGGGGHRGAAGFQCKELPFEI